MLRKFIAVWYVGRDVKSHRRQATITKTKLATRRGNKK